MRLHIFKSNCLVTLLVWLMSFKSGLFVSIHVAYNDSTDIYGGTINHFNRCYQEYFRKIPKTDGK